MNKKNLVLEFWRFAFCIAVLGVHLFPMMNKDFFRAGYLGVEFFFIVAGYFIGSYYSRYQKEKRGVERLKSVGSYAWSRLKRLYPLYGLSLLFMLLVRSYINHYQFQELLNVIQNCLAEFFLLQWTPMGNEVLLSAGWFVPAVFFGGIFYVVLLAITGKAGGFILAPVISFLIYRYYFILIGKIDVIYQYHGILRGIAGIGTGVFVCFLCEKVQKQMQKQALEKKDWNKWIGRGCLLFVNVMFSMIFVYTNYGHRSRWDFLIIFFYGAGVFLLMLNKVNLPEKWEKLFLFLGKITYPIYIFQMPIIELLLSGRAG